MPLDLAPLVRSIGRVGDAPRLCCKPLANSAAVQTGLDRAAGGSLGHNQPHWDGGPLPSELSGVMRRHRCYSQLLAICLAVMVTFALPKGLNWIGLVGYNLLPLVIIRGLGEPFGQRPFGRVPHRLFRLLGIAAFLSSLVWTLTPVTMRGTGVLMLVLWGGFVGWSSLRLIRGLAQEPEVSEKVLMGALAGYLLVGLTAGLLFSALETVVPGSFTSANGSGAAIILMPGAEDVFSSVWKINFMRLNYFAFVCLTTVGFGDIVPLTPQAQMFSVAVSLIGTTYLALVMGVLISRYRGVSGD